MPLLDAIRKSAEEVAAMTKQAAASTWESVQEQAKKKVSDIWKGTEKRVIDATSSEPIRVTFTTPTPTPTPPAKQKTLVEQGYQRIGQSDGKEVFYRRNMEADGGFDLVDADGRTLKEVKPKVTPKVVPQVLAASTDGSMFKKEREEPGQLGELIKQTFPESQWQKVPVVMDGENGGRVANMSVDPNTGKRYYINDPQQLLDLAEANRSGKGVDTGIMQINSNTFFDYWNRRGNQSGTYPFREIMQREGINSYADMLDPLLNMKMARIIWNQQGWSAWYGAPAEYRGGQ